MNETIISYHNPGKMSVKDRITEISRILAAGFNRLSVSHQNPRNQLDDVDRERPHVTTTKIHNTEVA